MFLHWKMLQKMGAETEKCASQLSKEAFPFESTVPKPSNQSSYNKTDLSLAGLIRFN